MAGGSKELGNRIRQLREEKRKTDPNFTGRHFSITLGISPTYLSKIETGDMPAGAALTGAGNEYNQHWVRERFRSRPYFQPTLKQRKASIPNVKKKGSLT